MSEKKVLLSIVSITYNHEYFIDDALISWLSQDVDFDFEIFIGDDASQDDTVKIIKQYQLKYPGKIHLIENPVNLGHQRNLLNTLKMSKGDFIAICAGDDYWIDPLKLQKQLRVFMQNPNCKMVYTNCYFLYGEELSNNTLVDYSKNFSFGIEDYLAQKYITIAPTSMIKRFDFDMLDKKSFLNSTLEDEYLFTYLIKDGGSIFYLADITGCYRVHPKGINSQQQTIKQLYYKLSTLNNLKFEFVKNETNNIIIDSFIKLNIDRLFNYTFDGFHGLSKLKIFKLIFQYKKEILLDYRFYYNWFFKRLIGK